MTEALNMLAAPKAPYKASCEERLQGLGKTMLAEILSILHHEKIKLTPNSLTITGDLSFEEWLEYGERLAAVDAWLKYGENLGNIEGSVCWWIGDYLNEGEKKYGKMYTQAFDAFILGMKGKTL